MNNPISNASASRVGIIAWCGYDWACSAFNTIVTTFVFATFFTKSIAVNPVVGTTQWGNAIALAGLIIAFSSPIFGAIADYQGPRKPWLAMFTLLAMVASALLWFAKPSVNYTTWILGCVIVGTIGYEIASVFYNAMLRDIAPPGYLGRISGWGWASGYLGGLISLSIALFAFIKTNATWLQLDNSAAESIRICGPFVALWFLLFSWPLFVFTKDRPARGIPITTAVKQGLTVLANTLRQLHQHRTIVCYLFARMIYTDGINTIFAFGGIYAVGTFGMTTSEVILFGIGMNVAAGIGAVVFAWVDDFIGAKPTILISLVAIIANGLVIVITKDITWFWVFAAALCLFVGPVQAASRSLMARLAPVPLMTEMFGLYAFSGKATAFMGPWLLALITERTGSQRAGIGTILIFLAVGMLFLYFVPVARENVRSRKIS
ncbi:MAG: MFS transporter [Gammaproteobacteria bacterium]